MPFTPPNPDHKPRRDDGGLQTLIQAEKLMQIAIMLPAAVFIGWLGGAMLDKLLHQGWISILGLFIGFAAGMLSVVRLIFAAGKDEGKRK